MDFVSDQLYDGRKVRALTLLDPYTRECLAIWSITPSVATMWFEH